MKYVFALLTSFVISFSVNTSFAQTPGGSPLDPPVDNGQCIDTDPVGDGFGWNGVCSCEVNTVVGFGSSISINNFQAAVGADQTPAGCVGSGSVSVFELSEQGEWRIQDELVSAVRSINDGFPNEVSISDNNVIASSGKTFLENGETNRLVIFTLEDGSWRETQQIDVNSSRSNLFSHSGNTLVIRSSTGSLVEFNRNPEGIWNEQSEIAITGALTDFALHGNTLVVASQDTDLLTVYEKADGAWQLQTQFDVPRAAISGDLNLFSQNSSLDVSEDTFALIPGFVFGANLSSAYTFSRTGNGSWVETFGVTVPDPDPQADTSLSHAPFGLFSPNGNRLLFFRDVFFSSPFDPNVIQQRDRHVEIFLFNNNVDSWSFGDTVSFSTEEGPAIFGVDYNAGFNGTNVLLGTGNDNTVLALTVDDAGRFVPMELNQPVDGDTSSDPVIEVSVDDMTDVANDVDAESTTDDSEGEQNNITPVDVDSETDNADSEDTATNNEIAVSNTQDGSDSIGLDSPDESTTQSGGGSFWLPLLIFALALRRPLRAIKRDIDLLPS